MNSYFASQFDHVEIQVLKNGLRVTLVAAFAALALWSIWLEFSGWVIGDSGPGMFATTVLVSVGRELAVIAIGVIVLDALIEWRLDGHLKAQLIRELAHGSNKQAQNAIEQLRAHPWLKDGSLRRTHLCNANLYQADLSDANLGRADLSGADLRDSSLADANLRKSNLSEADLSDACLWGADLKEAKLEGANLQNADLREVSLVRAELSDACLLDADLEGADLYGANFGGRDWRGDRGYSHHSDWILQSRSLKDATMPDGVKYEDWIEETIDEGEMEEFFESLMRAFDSHQEEE